VELEKLKVAEASYKAFKNLDRRIGGYVKNLNMLFEHIDADADIGTDAAAATT